MFNKLSVALCTGLILAGFMGHASAECLPASGKITNNAQQGGNTQGVVALNLDRQKLKCALIGVAQPETDNGPNFLHTLVCDDKALPDEAQSQLTLKTWFASAPVITGYCEGENPFGPVSFSFEEISIPDPITARGDFIGVTDNDSLISITGDYNCEGGITMKFDGQLCFSE